MKQRIPDDIPVFDRARNSREARELTRALEYAASFEPEAYHDADEDPEAIPDGFQLVDLNADPYEMDEEDESWR